MPAAMTPRRSSLVTLALLVAMVLTLLVPTPARAADAGAEAAFLNAVNAERSAAGLPAVSVAGDLVAVARAHSVRMADSATLHHNPDLGTDVTGWQRVGENVGKGPDVGAIHAAFMASPGHRANILDGTWTEVGIGVEVRDGRIWVTEVFRQPMAAAAAAPAAPAPEPEPEPEPEPAPEPAPAPATAPQDEAQDDTAPADDAASATETVGTDAATDGRILQMLTRVASEDAAIDAAAA